MMKLLACRHVILSALIASMLVLTLTCGCMAQAPAAEAGAIAKDDGTTACSSVAGRGQNVLLIVNPESWASLTVANHYAAIRGIPATNIVSIPFKLDMAMDTTDMDSFREKLLAPVLKYIEDHKLQHIDTIVWSADFPSSVDFTKENNNQQLSIGSINGLTFLYQAVLAKSPKDYLNLGANFYFRQHRPTGKKDTKGEPFFDVEDPLPFSAAKSYGQGDAARKYYLSMMLGVTSGRGNSVTEVVEGLKRSASADGTNPQGMWYYLFDGSIRTNTRHWGFKSAIAKLESIGQQARQENYTWPKDPADTVAVPKNKDDILGAMCGHQYINPARSGSKTVPGALVENLTSEGGIMSWAGYQVPISALIRFGSAGTSGTVTEPFAIQAKFPSPFMFYHYAKGASVAEAFYLSVQGPYQLLILGDPLCQPFAKLPKIEGVTPGAVLTKFDAASVRPVAADGQKIAAMQLFADGSPVKDAGELASLGDGYHEVVAAAVCDGPMCNQSSVRFGVVQGKPMEFAASAKEVILGKTLKLTAAMPGAKKIEILHLGRVVKSVDGDKAQFEIDSAQLGLGPVRLMARATVGDKTVQAVPVTVAVKPPPMIPAATVDDKAAWTAGALLTGPDLEPYVVADMRRTPPLHNAKVKPGSAWKLEGYVTAPADDVYQFQVCYGGKVMLKVDGQPIAMSEGASWRFAPLSLAKGKHLFVFESSGGESREIDIRFGGPGSRSMGAANSQFLSATTQPAK